LSVLPKRDSQLVSRPTDRSISTIETESLSEDEQLDITNAVVQEEKP